jgi:hypothetical protein
MSSAPLTSIGGGLTYTVSNNGTRAN